MGSWTPRRFFPFLLLLVIASLSASAQPRQNQEGVRYLEPSYSQENVDIGALVEQMRRLGVDIPIDVRGKVSFSLKAGIPWNALTNGDAYRFDGSLLSEQLVFGPVTFTNLEATLRYRQRVLSLAPLRFDVHLSGSDGKPGTLLGKASIDLHRDGLLTAAIELRDLPWADITELLVLEGIDLQGRVSGNANFTVPIQKMYDPIAMTGDVQLRSGTASWMNLAARGGEVDLKLQRGVVDLSRFFIELETGSVAGTGRLDLSSMAYDAKVTLRELPIASGVEFAAGSLPLRVGGNVQGTFTANGSLAPFDYRVKGTLSGNDIAIAAAENIVAEAELDFDSQRVAVRQFQIEIADGTVRGSGELAIETSQWRAEVTATDLSVPRLLRELTPPPYFDAIREQLATLYYASDNADPLPNRGRLSAKLSSHGQLEPLAYAVNGSANLADLAIGPETDLAIATEIALDDGVLTMAPVKASALGGTAEGTVTIDTGENTWNGTLNWREVSLARVSPYLPRESYQPLKGETAAQLKFHGKLSPFGLLSSGEIQVRDAEAQGVRVPAGELAFALTKDHLEVKQFAAEIFKGEVQGTALVPLDLNQSWRLKATARNIDLAELDRLPVPMPASFDGLIDADVEGELTALRPGEERLLTGEASLRAPLVRANNLVITELKGVATADGKTVRYDLAAELLRGGLEVSGRAPLTTSAQGTADFTGSARLRQIQLAALTETAASRGIALGGQLDAALEYRHQPGRLLPEGSGRVEVRGLRFERNDLARSLQGDVRLQGGRLELTNFGGNVLGGTLRSSASVNLNEWNNAALFSMTLNQAQLSAVAAIFPTVPALPGTAQVQLRGRLGSEIFAQGSAGIRRTEYQNLQLESVQVPFELRYAIATGRGQMNVRESSFHLAGGRVRAAGSLAWLQNMNVDGDVQFVDVRLNSLLKQTLGPTQFVNGRLSGRASIRGERISSLGDAQVRLQGTLRQTVAQQLPVIGKLLPYFGSLTAGAPTFDTGEIDAVYSSDRLRIRSLTLEGSSLRMTAEGEIRSNGRINLEVIAASGPRSLADRALQGIATKFLVAAVPALAIVEANELLKDRVVYLVVTGTIQSPVVRVRPVPTLGAEAIRFFLKGL